MRAITAHRVQFGELAGPLVHGATFFDWELIATQAVVRAFDYSFEAILADGGIPFAPVAVATSVRRYPTTGDTVHVDAVPLNVGDSSVELLYEVVDDGGDPFATARMTHVTIGPDGRALALPESIRADFADACVDRRVAVGPAEGSDGDGGDEGDDRPAFDASFPVRSPHVEGAELAYFEEYPRFADVALEEFLVERGTSLAELSGERQPFRIRDWRWEFRSPVPFESTLRVDCDVRAVEAETVRVAHTLTSDGRTSIEGITEYGCFDRSGAPVAFDEDALAPFEA